MDKNQLIKKQKEQNKQLTKKTIFNAHNIIPLQFVHRDKRVPTENDIEVTLPSFTYKEMEFPEKIKKFSIGDIWIDESEHNIYICLNKNKTKINWACVNPSNIFSPEGL